MGVEGRRGVAVPENFVQDLLRAVTITPVIDGFERFVPLRLMLLLLLLLTFCAMAGEGDDRARLANDVLCCCHARAKQSRLHLQFFLFRILGGGACEAAALDIAPSALRGRRNSKIYVKLGRAINHAHFDFWATPRVTYAARAQSVATQIPLVEIEPERFTVQGLELWGLDLGLVLGIEPEDTSFLVHLDGELPQVLLKTGDRQSSLAWAHLRVVHLYCPDQ